MKNIIIILLISFPIFIFAQETKKVTNKNKRKGYKEVYYALKSDKNIKHGNYKKYNSRKILIAEGNYSQGKKEGTWVECSNSGNQKIFTGKYKNDKQIGVWTYFDFKGKIEQKYDFDNQKIIYFSKENDRKPYRILLNDNIFETMEIDQPVLYIGGKTKIFHHIFQTLRYPAFARENGVEGTVVIGITINKEGEATDYEVFRKIEDGLAQEAIRVLKLLPNNWTPAIYNGEIVIQQLLLPIKFKLSR